MPATVLSSVQINGDTPGIFPNGPTGQPTMGDPVQASRLFSLQATAVASLTTPIALPLGARIVAITVLPSVAFTGAPAQVSVGTSSGGAQIVAATTIAGAQVVLAIALGAAVPLTGTSAGGSPVFITLAQTTPTAVGTAVLFIEYVMA